MELAVEAATPGGGERRRRIGQTAASARKKRASAREETAKEAFLLVSSSLLSLFWLLASLLYTLAEADCLIRRTDFTTVLFGRCCCFSPCFEVISSLCDERVGGQRVSQVAPTRETRQKVTRERHQVFIERSFTVTAIFYIFFYFVPFFYFFYSDIISVSLLRLLRLSFHHSYQLLLHLPSLPQSFVQSFSNSNITTSEHFPFTFSSSYNSDRLQIFAHEPSAVSRLLTANQQHASLLAFSLMS